MERTAAREAIEAARAAADAGEWEQAWAAAADVLERAGGDLAVLCELGEATQALVDLRYLNAAPPTHPVFAALATALVEAEPASEGQAVARDLALSTAARICGRAWDEICAAAHGRLLETRPDTWTVHYNYGLFCKTRGRFADGAAANAHAANLASDPPPGVLWNEAICATGAGDGPTALRVSIALGMKLVLGDDGLPAGRFPICQVRLAERPVAERDADHDHPGLEETVWVERLSACHGRIRSALYQDLGVDYGDLVLFDGAPIVMRTWGDSDEEVPVFPHLATLRHDPWLRLPFAATQRDEGQVAALSDALPDECAFYVHTEAYRQVCRTCWEKRAQDHDHDADVHPVVTGKLVVPPGVEPSEVVTALDAALAGTATVKVYVPELRERAGGLEDVEDERRRFELLWSAPREA